MRAANRDSIEPFISCLLPGQQLESKPTLPRELPLGKRKALEFSGLEGQSAYATGGSVLDNT
jgi:hypothetical protein